jgi:hypothetical protein
MAAAVPCLYIWHHVRELQVVFTTDFGSYSNYNTLSISLRISKLKSVVITSRVLLGNLVPHVNNSNSYAPEAYLPIWTIEVI